MRSANVRRAADVGPGRSPRPAPARGDAVQGSTLDAAETDRQIEACRTRSADERRGTVGLQPARAEVILAGACIVRTVLSKLGREALTVSDRGPRHGVRAERFA